MLVSRAEELKLWGRMRPFVEDGSVKLAPLSPPSPTVVEDVEKLMASPAIQLYLQRMWEEMKPAMPYLDDATRAIVTNTSKAIGVERLIALTAFRAISGGGFHRFRLLGSYSRNPVLLAV
jgi:hypothetical protein